MNKRDWSWPPLVGVIGIVLMVSVAISHYDDGVPEQPYTTSAQAAPVQYNVAVNVTWPPPIPTPTETPNVRLTPSPTAMGDCATSTPNYTVCTKLLIPSTEVPPKDCNDPDSDAGESCMWVWTPTPRPTSTPVPVRGLFP